jgi:hypothetical protein
MLQDYHHHECQKLMHKRTQSFVTGAVHISHRFLTYYIDNIKYMLIYCVLVC